MLLYFTYVKGKDLLLHLYHQNKQKQRNHDRSN